MDSPFSTTAQRFLLSLWGEDRIRPDKVPADQSG
jgi:hypothetical protein